MENNNGKGIFYGVIGVATLVVAIIGATFAYFASTTQGTNGAAAANSADVKGKLAITQTGQYIATDLIPASNDTMLKSFKQTGTADVNTGKCRGASAADHNANYGMCSYYSFKIANTADVPTTVYLSLRTDENTFDGTDFKYCVYEGTTTDKPAHECVAVPAKSGSERFASVNLAATTGEAEYTIILYYEDNGDQTDKGSGRAYAATVTASTSDGTSQIVGYIVSAG